MYSLEDLSNLGGERVSVREAKRRTKFDSGNVLVAGMSTVDNEWKATCRPVFNYRRHVPLARTFASTGGPVF